MTIHPTFQLNRVPDAFVRATIERDHYLKRWPDPRSLPFAYALSVSDRQLASDGRPHGIIVFKKPQHHKQRALFGHPGLPTSWQILDMARVWVHPSLQSCRWIGPDRSGKIVTHSLCIFSRMVALSLARVQRDWIAHHPPRFPDLPYHVELILSYCDRQHHQGVGYRASGFTLHGPTADDTKDLYVRHLRLPRWRWSDNLFATEEQVYQ